MHSTVSHEGTNAPLSHITITLIIIVPMNMVATIIITIGIVFKTLARGSDKGGTEQGRRHQKPHQEHLSSQCASMQAR